MNASSTPEFPEIDPVVAALRAAIATDPVPPELLAAAKASLTWRTIDAELAALAFDSAESGELVGARGVVTGPRALSFETGHASIELELDGGGSTFDLVGQVSPAVIERIEVQHAQAGPIPGRLGDHGRFDVSGVPAGPIRLLVGFAGTDGPAMLITEWVTV